jgi:hypothetical protein
MKVPAVFLSLALASAVVAQDNSLMPTCAVRSPELLLLPPSEAARPLTPACYDRLSAQTLL